MFIRKCKIKVKVPTLPKYIAKIINILPKPLSSEVRPKLKPTVLKAEKTSNTIDLNDASLLVIEINITNVLIKNKATNDTIKALFIVFAGISFPNTIVLFLFLM